ncbi:MAG TPA: hypothetical protein VNG13_00955 [Mycobacteriales bacterium]|nr:hypothetical protein [Mycobacteriales bacterium]
MRTSLRWLGVGGAGAAVAAAVALLASNRAAPVPPTVLAVESSTRGGSAVQSLEVFSVGTGALVRVLTRVSQTLPLAARLGAPPAPPRPGGVVFTGFSRGSDGEIWYATSPQPQLRGHDAGSVVPHSCGGAVYRIPRSGGPAVRVLEVGPDATVSAPSPSPDRAWIAYLTGPCVTGARGLRHVVVRSLSDGRQYTVNVAGSAINNMSWSRDSRRIAVAAYLSLNTHGRLYGYTIVPAGRSVTVSQMATRVALLPVYVNQSEGAYCLLASVAFDARGLAAFAQCFSAGAGNPSDGHGVVAQYTSDGSTLLWQVPVPVAGDSYPQSALNPDQSGDRVLVIGPSNEELAVGAVWLSMTGTVHPIPVTTQTYISAPPIAW